MKRAPFGIFFLILSVTAVSQASADDLYAQFQPKQTSRIREGTEWSMTYSYGVTNSSLPRVLVIGDSICNAYQGMLGPKLKGKANVTYWASSKCVTDPDYFRELDLILGANNYAFISFNNGLHSLEGTNPGEWEAAYFAAVKFIRAKCPGAKLSLATSTPIANEKRNETVKRLNAIVQKVAEDERLPVIDLYEVSEKIDSKKRWCDGVHFDKPGIDAQAEAINAAARKVLNIK